MKRETMKVFAPITESQQKVTEVAEKGFAETQKALVELPKQIAIELPTPLKTVLPTLGDAEKHLKKYLNKSAGDMKYGIYTKGDKFYIGNKEVKFDNNDFTIDDFKYRGMPELWELVTNKEPKNYTLEDLTSYSKILYFTDAMYVLVKKQLLANIKSGQV